VASAQDSLINFVKEMEMTNLYTNLDQTNIPKHVAFIMDGNGRWAKSQGQHRLFGHAAGVESVKEIIKTAREIGVQFLTMYAFSTENWNRPAEEVAGLMDLLVQAITNETDDMHKNGVRLLTIGDIDALPEGCVSSLKEAIDKTKDNTALTLILALNYSARWEITNACKLIAEKVKQGALSTDQITEDQINKTLNTSMIPDPELLIRTSGECRISNFLLWQLSYTELYFTAVHWPEFRRAEFIHAICAFQQRERRFGLTSEQLNEHK
jgi:undecaprenyl diphosphate synthase